MKPPFSRQLARRAAVALCFASTVISAHPAHAQGSSSGQQRPSEQGTQQQAPPAQQQQTPTRATKTPPREALYEAHKNCADLFANLANGNTEEAARWITDEVGYTRDDDAKQQMRDGFRQKLDAVIASPPASPYGKLSG